MQPVGEEIGRGAKRLLLIVVVGGELVFPQIVGDATAGFIDARGAGAEHDANARRAERLDRLPDLVVNLQRGFQQQLVIAAAMGFQPGRYRRQFTVHSGHRQHTLRHPAAFGAHAGAVAGKQAAADFALVAAQGADHAEGIEVGAHRAAPSGEMW